MASFREGPLSRSNWNLEMLVFTEGEKLENQEKNTPSKRINKQTQHKYGTQPESNQDHIAGTRAVSPLHNFCFPLQRSESSFSAHNHKYKSCEVLRRQILENSVLDKFKICQLKS